MWNKKAESNFDAQTIKLFNRMIQMRRERGLDNNKDFNVLMQELFLKEIQFIKDENPTMEDINERNIRRLLDLKNEKKAYCPMYHQKIINIGGCMFCSYGHMTECHYPYTCDTEYCHHYPEENNIMGEDFE